MSTSLGVQQPGSLHEPKRSDRLTNVLVVTLIALAVLVVTVLAYAVVQGVFSTSAPRTLMESQIQDFESQVKADPGNGKVWAQYILALTSAKQPLRAQDALSRANASVTQSGTADVQLAAAYYYNSVGNTASRDKALASAISIDRTQRTASLVAQLKKGIRVTPQSQAWDNSVFFDAHNFKARLALQKRDYKAALFEYDTMLLVDPQASDILTARGDAELGLGQKAKAAADYRTALKFVPDYAAALQGLKNAGDAK